MNPKLRLFLTAERAFGLESVRRPSGDGAIAPHEALSQVAPIVSNVRQGAAVKLRTPPVQPAVATPAVVQPMEQALPLPNFSSPFTSAVLSTSKKKSRLQTLDESQVRACTKCRLCKTRTQTVFGEGDVDAQLLFIGEGPGENEDLTGRPFVGRAGQLLDKMIMAMGLQREQVYIANIVKCRPPDNRAPMPDETAACTPYLMEQIETVRPKVIVTLGLPATRFILQKDLSMGKMRGIFHDWRGLQVMPTYHPSYVLRSYTPQTRAAVWSDLQQVMQMLGLKGASKKSEAP